MDVGTADQAQHRQPVAEPAVVGLQLLVTVAVAVRGKRRPAMTAAIDHARHPHPVRHVAEHGAKEGVQCGVDAQRARLVHQGAAFEDQAGNGAAL